MFYKEIKKSFFYQIGQNVFQYILSVRTKSCIFSKLLNSNKLKNREKLSYGKGLSIKHTISLKNALLKERTQDYPSKNISKKT